MQNRLAHLLSIMILRTLALLQKLNIKVYRKITSHRLDSRSPTQLLFLFLVFSSTSTTIPYRQYNLHTENPVCTRIWVKKLENLENCATSHLLISIEFPWVCRVAKYDKNFPHPKYLVLGRVTNALNNSPIYRQLFKSLHLAFEIRLLLKVTS